MKCIKSTQEATLGKIDRFSDVEAEKRVKTGGWIYITKSEWRLDHKGENPVMIEKVKEPKSVKNTDDTNLNKKEKRSKKNESKKTKK